MDDVVRILHYLAGSAITASIFGIFALGLNVHWGYTGLFNIGVAGFFAIGAYTTALVTTPLPSGISAIYIQQAFGLDQPFLVGVIAAGLVAGLLAIPIGFLTLRLRGDYLAITTIGIAETIRRVFNNEEWLANGADGLDIGQPLRNLSFIPPNRYNFVYLIIVVIFMVVIYLALERGIRSPWGRVLRAVREDEVVAAATGKDVFQFKMQSLVLGAVIMGIGGALYAHYAISVNPSDFSPMYGTFIIWAMLILGGSGNNKGAILGAFIVWGIWSGTMLVTREIIPAMWSARAHYFRFLLIGLLILGTLLSRPQGIRGEEKQVSRML